MNIESVAGCLITIMVTVGGIFLARIKFKSHNNPASVYCLLWGGATFLVASNFSSNFFPVSFTTILIFNASVFFFVSGSLLVPLKFKLNSCLYAPTYQSTPKNHKFIFLLINAICIVGAGSFLYWVVNRYGIAAYIGRGYEIHADLLTGEKSEVFPLGVLGYQLITFLLHPLIYVSAALGAMFVATTSNLRWYYFLPLLAAILYDLAMLGRFRFYTVLVMYVFSFIVSPLFNRSDIKVQRQAGRKTGNRKVFIYFFLLFGILGYVSMAFMRSYYASKYYDIYGLNVPSILFTPIRYQIGGLYLFDKSINLHQELQLGMEMAYPFIGKLLNFLNIIEIKYEYSLGNRIQVGKLEEFQAFATMHMVGYRDYGVPGILFNALILGFLSAWVYGKALASRRRIWVANLVFFYAMLILPSTMLWGFGETGRVMSLYFMVLATLMTTFRIASRGTARTANFQPE